MFKELFNKSNPETIQLFPNNKETNKIDTFLCHHFKHTGYSLNKVSVQPVEKLYTIQILHYIKNVKRQGTENTLDFFFAMSFSFSLQSSSSSDKVYHQAVGVIAL